MKLLVWVPFFVFFHFLKKILLEFVILLTLQYCVSFRCIAEQISYTYNHYFLDSFPMWAIRV